MAETYGDDLRGRVIARYEPDRTEPALGSRVEAGLRPDAIGLDDVKRKP